MAEQAGSKVTSNWFIGSFTITQIFGAFEDVIINGIHISQPHTGIDIAMPVGTVLFAPAHAVVKGAGTDQYGNRFVRLLMDNGNEVLLLHLDKVLVSTGQDISPGKTVGTSGNSGLSTGPHLHFEVDQNGKPIDPWTTLTTQIVNPGGINPSAPGIPNPLDALASVGAFFTNVNKKLTKQNFWRVGFVSLGIGLIGLGVFIYFFKEEAAVAKEAAGTAEKAAVLAA